MKQHTAGAIRAATIINNNQGWSDASGFKEFMAGTIDKETHAAEMRAFIKKVEEEILHSDHEMLRAIKREALELIEKVRD